MRMILTEPDIQDIFSVAHDLSDDDKILLRKAYDFSKNIHGGEVRFTGESFFWHPFLTAKNLAEYGMDAPSIAAGLLHDVIEDGDTSEEEVRSIFGDEIVFLVDGVSKLGKLKYQGLERHAESLRKLFIATAKDIRVIIIKIADRVHNAQTLSGHPKLEKRQRIALETRDIYAPLADRLGMVKIRGDLNDLAFMHLNPHEYAQTVAQIHEKRSREDRYIQSFRRALEQKINSCGIENIEISCHEKHVYSLYKKLTLTHMDIEKVYDVTVLRVVANDVDECYRILGIIHSAWKPLPGYIKDYIALPKPGGYQSIHTTVFSGDGGIVEVQIRTRQMHRDAMYGIAPYIRSSGGRLYITRECPERDLVITRLAQFGELIEWQKGIAHSDEFLAELHKVDLFRDRIFVFTPKSDPIDLPVDATPIDFAYTIHSDLGNHMSGARVNGKMVSLDTELRNGDMVEIITKTSAKPSRKWYDMAKTSMARKHIRAALAAIESQKR